MHLSVLRTSSDTLPEYETCALLPHPVVALDGEGYVAYANAAALEAFGQRLVGQHCSRPFANTAHPIATLRREAGRSKITCDDGAQLRLMSSPLADGGAILSFFPEETGDTGGEQTDELTGLLKRNGLIRCMTDAQANPRTPGAALHFLDLDRFKIINDTLGHAIGDLLLVKVANRMRAACRKTDSIARFGGDEFVVLQQDVESRADAEQLAARLVDLVGRTYVINGHTINIGASVGVALFEGQYGARDFLRQGDLALYEAKRAGRGRFRVFEPAMDEAMRTRRELEIELRRALALKQFELHFQPFVDAASGQVRGYEALIRWKHPVRGWVSPADFIPLAEETGVIAKIGEWVLRTACRAAAAWPADQTVAVNVSPMQFKADDLVQTVRSALHDADLAAERLEVEITEGALLDDTPTVLKTLYALKDLGVKISMDDFGTGYSSLSYLQKFPFSKIKIDRSFVQGATSGGENEAILKAIAGLGRSLGMAITAEGVETEEQLQKIRLEQCTLVQGYLTGRPQPAENLPQLSRTEK